MPHASKNSIPECPTHSFNRNAGQNPLNYVLTHKFPWGTIILSHARRQRRGEGFTVPSIRVGGLGAWGSFLHLRPFHSVFRDQAEQLRKRNSSVFSISISGLAGRTAVAKWETARSGLARSRASRMLKNPCTEGKSAPLVIARRGGLKSGTGCGPSAAPKKPVSKPT